MRGAQRKDGVGGHLAKNDNVQNRETGLMLVRPVSSQYNFLI